MSKMVKTEEQLLVAIGEYMEYTLPDLVSYELHECGQYRTLEWCRSQMDGWDKIQEDRAEKDIVDFVKRFIIDEHGLDEYWEMEAEDMRHNTVYKVYHEYRKYMCKTYNRKADKYLHQAE